MNDATRFCRHMNSIVMTRRSDQHAIELQNTIGAFKAQVSEFPGSCYEFPDGSVAEFNLLFGYVERPKTGQL